MQAAEYGFWANVNPQVPHPRWSQATEELIGLNERRPTLLFNGYGEYVADLYKGLEKERLWVRPVARSSAAGRGQNQRIDPVAGALGEIDRGAPCDRLARVGNFESERERGLVGVAGGQGATPTLGFHL